MNIKITDKSEETYLTLTEEHIAIGRDHGIKVMKGTGRYHLNYDPNFCQLHLGEVTANCNNGGCDE